MSDSGDRAATHVDHEAWTGRGFIVQLRRDADPAQGIHRGRVQHARSGEAAHFESLDELAAFFARWILTPKVET